MNISLTPQLEKFIKGQVASGHYNNASEVLREAVRLLMRDDEERRAKIARLRAMGEDGERDIAAGRFTTLKTAKDFDKFFRSL
jgi:antitoxin ParD1/3/4